MRLLAVAYSLEVSTSKDPWIEIPLVQPKKKRETVKPSSSMKDFVHMIAFQSIRYFPLFLYIIFT